MRWAQRDAILLPDRRSWGRGYGGIPYTGEALEETRGYIEETLIQGGLPGYGNRGLIRQAEGFAENPNGFILPPGFDAENPDRRSAPSSLVEAGQPTSLADTWRVAAPLQRYYQSCDWKLDQHGRPVHPLAMQILEANIPVCTNFGAGYEFGETIVVDTVVTDGEAVLFNTRKDNGKTIPSLVGGYTHATDYTSLAKWRSGNRPIARKGIFTGVRRILADPNKAGIIVPEHAKFEIVWGIRPWSSYHTLNFWTLTYTVKVLLDWGMSQQLMPTSGAFWHPTNKIKEIARDLWPDHRRGLEAALRR